MRVVHPDRLPECVGKAGSALESRRPYGSIYKIALSVLLPAALLWCGAGMVKSHMEDKKLFEYLLYSDMEDMPDTFLPELWEQKGVEAVSAVLDIPVHMEIEEYEMDVSLRAVDTEIFPLKIDRCLTELEAGSKIPLYFTAQALESLTDQNQYKITKGKKEDLIKRSLGMTAVISPVKGESQEPETAADDGIWKQMTAVYRETGIFAAVLEDRESRVYIPYESGKKILELAGSTVQVRTVYIKIRGKSKADELVKKLEEMGFEAEAL